MKKLTLFLIGFLVVSLFNPNGLKAMQSIKYNKPTNVAVVNSSSGSITTQGTFQLINLDTNSISYLPTKTALTFKKASNGISVQFAGSTIVSNKGFQLLELNSLPKMVIFNQSAPLRKGATVSYDVIKQLNSGEAAPYLGTFTNFLGEVWYNVSSDSGNGWVSAKDTSFQEAINNTLNLGKLSNGRTYRGSYKITPKGTNIQIVNTLDLENYLKGVVPNEMPSSWHKEALKAQAIAARSYAANSMTLSDTASSQVYRGYSSENSRSNAAIQETDGLVVRYNGKVIQTFFFSTSGGQTANVGDVWNSNQASFPYLVSVNDPYEDSIYSNWSVDFSPQQVLTQFGFNPTTTSLLNMSLNKPGQNGEVRGVTIETTDGSKTIEGNESVIRKLFPIPNSSYYNMLYSNWFDVKLTKQSNSFSVQTPNGSVTMNEMNGQSVQTASGITTVSSKEVEVQMPSGIQAYPTVNGVSNITLNGKGWGHRIGMSQYGANGFAEKGWTAEQIITHYFKGTTVSK
ncbi:SpoIID/LytB domain-containing protein [Bacillus sp. P14.5]|uniref:SpoIID/LytB domain-containing protein n=1 Tax=Bacillus sp. P14.5 TaxID=1983400 RepID=UPI000DEB987B|nr:SpoIID/LytB domain-containing protein [Bacillus sp. P14.5]